MLKNYFLVAIRNLKRNKSYTFINVLGLAVGISGALVVTTMIYSESKFNSFHTDNVSNVHRIVNKVTDHDDVKHFSTVPHPLGEALKLEYPELEAVTMMYAMGGLQINVEDKTGLKKFKDDYIAFANNDVFDILHFDWASSFDPNALSTPNSIIISTKMAEKYFNVISNHEILIGKILRLENQKNMVIKGVYHDFPQNTDFPFELIANYFDQDGINRYFGEGKLWGRFNGNTNCYIKLNDASNAADFEQGLVGFAERQNIMEGLELKLQRLEELHYDSRYSSYGGYIFGSTAKLTLTLVGVFLLVIACINFINLSTAQSITRSKEVGIRKVMGSNKKNLIGQFMIETLCTVLLAHALALGFAEIWFYIILTFMNVDIGLAVFSVLDFMLYFGGIILLTTILAGMYPSFVTSSFSPLDALKIKLTSGKSTGGLFLRRTLVILQFVFTQTIIIGTLVVMSQFDFLVNADLGFEQKGIVSIILPKENRDKVPVFMTELERKPEFSLTSAHLGSPIARTNNTDKFYWSKMGKENVFSTNNKSIDENYLDVFGIKLLAGDNLSKDENKNNVLVNLKTIQSMGIDNPRDAIGEELASTYGSKRIIKGVVSDFNSFTLRSDLYPVIMSYDVNYFDEVAVKLNYDDPKSRQLAIASIDAEWNKIWPNHIMDYDFLDESMARFYKRESVMADLFKVFATISIIISCLGVYGLIDFMANKRRKEIGIRKVLGATVANILRIFSKEVLILLVLSFAIAGPLVYIGMGIWLESFAYRIDIGFNILSAAFVISLALTLLTISYRSIKASNTNPAISLKDE